MVEMANGAKHNEDCFQMSVYSENTGNGYVQLIQGAGAAGDYDILAWRTSSWKQTDSGKA
jgi:hypothetical protein